MCDLKYARGRQAQKPSDGNALDLIKAHLVALIREHNRSGRRYSD
jgi:hypothetical protein